MRPTVFTINALWDEDATVGTGRRDALPAAADH